MLKFPQLSSRCLDSWFIKPVSTQGPYHLLLICDTQHVLEPQHRTQAQGAQSTPDASEEGLEVRFYKENRAGVMQNKSPGRQPHLAQTGWN